MDDLLILDVEKVPGIRCRDLRNGRLRTGKKNGTAAFARHLEVGWVPPTNVGGIQCEVLNTQSSWQTVQFCWFSADDKAHIDRGSMAGMNPIEALDTILDKFVARMPYIIYHIIYIYITVYHCLSMLIRACPESFVEIQVCLAAKHPPGSSGFICSPAEQEAEHL
jgi:hypothetical protein